MVAWKTAEYGFVKREGRHNDDIQLHVANAKGERFKKYVRRYGMQAGVRVKFDVDFEEPHGSNHCPVNCCSKQHDHISQ